MTDVDTFRALILADVHLSSKLPHARQAADADEGVTDRLQDIEGVLYVAAQAAAAERVDAVFIVGDFLDRSEVDGPTGAAAVRALRQFGCPVFVGPGNHEARSPRGAPFCTEFIRELPEASPPIVWMGQPGGVYRLRDSFNILPPWLSITWIDYSSTDVWRARAAGALEIAQTIDGDAHKALMLHQSVVGCNDGGWTCDDGLVADDFAGWDEAISGHFHERQGFKDFDAGRYVGSSSHLSHSDEHDAVRGYEIATWRADGNHESLFVEVDQPRFRTLKITADGVAEAETFIEGAADFDYVRIVVSSTHASWSTVKDNWESMVSRHRVRLRLLELTHEPLYHHGAGEHRARLVTKDLRPSQLVRSYVLSGIADVGDLDPELLIAEGVAMTEET